MKRWLTLLLVLTAATAVCAATYTGSTIPDLDTATPDGATEAVSVLDDAIREAKKAVKETYYDWASLTNRTGATLVIGDVLAIDTANDSSVAVADTLNTARPLVVALQATANATAGLFARTGVVTAKVQGAVTRGNYLRKSATASALEDTATLVANATMPPVGAVAVALEANASGSATKKVLFFGTPVGVKLTGTASEITVTDAAGSVTLSLVTPLAFGKGGTGLATAVDDTVMVSSGTAWVAKAVPDCTAATSALQYAIATNAFSCGTISSGVAAGDSPTWTGTHTWSGVGPRIKLTGAAGDTQIFLGSQTDPGWTASAIDFASADATATSWIITRVGGLRFAVNAYSDGSSRYIATAIASALEFGGASADFRYAASGTAGTVISWVTEVSITSSGTVHGAPIGGSKGAGTINAVAVYDDNILLTDWVFDLYFDGAARPNDPYYRQEPIYTIDQTIKAIKELRRLPWMPTRENFEHERSLGKMVSRLWVGQELQQLYIMELAGRLEKLESNNAK